MSLEDNIESLVENQQNRQQRRKLSEGFHLLLSIELNQTVTIDFEF